MSVVINNMRLTVKRGISHGEIVQEVRAKETNAHVDCPVSVFLLRPWYIDLSESLIFLYVLVLLIFTRLDYFFGR